MKIKITSILALIFFFSFAILFSVKAQTPPPVLNGCVLERGSICSYTDLRLFSQYEVTHHMRGFSCTYCDFAMQGLMGTDFRDSDFTGSNFTGVSLTQANLKGANFTNANLTNVFFNGANTEGMILDGAYLCNTYMSDSSVRNDSCSN